jgi:hypothetical protein
MRISRKLIGFFLVIIGLVVVFEGFAYNVELNYPFGMAISLAGAVLWLNSE